MASPGGASPPGPTPVPPPVPVPQAPPIVITVEVTLAGATTAAQQQLYEAIKDYAERLTEEAETQELSKRQPGVRFFEVTANSVALAKASLDKFGHRAKPSGLELAALLGVPIFSGASGVMGGFLHSAWQTGVFSACVFIGVTCLAYLAARRML